jgi:preprotein translocase subunit SecD
MVLRKKENRMKLSWRIWLLIIVLVLAALIISPNFEKGVVIKSVEQNSTAFEQGLKPNMIITAINSQQIKTLADYTTVINSIFPNQTLADNIKLIITTKDSEFVLFTNQAPKITVSDIPKTRIKTGLDLSGGARALVKPEVAISSAQLNDLITITSNRFNTFGIADVSVRSVSDLSGNNFMLVEVAGATPSDLSELVSKQGKFEAKIGNQTVFVGGNEDITYVARTGEQSGIYSCNTYQEGDVCQFRFAITLSEAAAKRQANLTNTLSLNSTNPEYLSEKLDLYLDDKLVDSLSISKDLKGKITTQISIQGSGTGKTRQEAYDDTVNNMKHLQTILITGSLPYKLEIVKIDSISPVLGKEFTKNILILAIVVFAAISITLFIKYRKIKITLAVILTMFSEAFITLAIAALIKWNLDAPSIAGIIAGMGTGVNDQIVIIDEAVSNLSTSLKERIKSALFVIFGAFFTIIAAMLPLFWAGAGMLKGFALTTIIGVSVGILITRPAFAEIVRRIQKE